MLHDELEKIVEVLRQLPHEDQKAIGRALIGDWPAAGLRPAAPRSCFMVMEDQYDSEGYIPSVVIEGESGHRPMMGSGEFAQPWYWGRPSGTTEGWEQAQRVCAEANEDKGLSEHDVHEIVRSSIIASFRADAAERRYQDAMDAARR